MTASLMTWESRNLNETMPSQNLERKWEFWIHPCPQHITLRPNKRWRPFFFSCVGPEVVEIPAMISVIARTLTGTVSRFWSWFYSINIYGYDFTISPESFRNFYSSWKPVDRTNKNQQCIRVSGFWFTVVLKCLLCKKKTVEGKREGTFFPSWLLFCFSKGFVNITLRFSIFGPLSGRNLNGENLNWDFSAFWGDLLLIG